MSRSEKLALPHEIYGGVIGFLSQEEAIRVIKVGSKLAPVALRHYPWNLNRARVCEVFSKENFKELAQNASLSPDSLLKCAMNKGVYDMVINMIKTKKISLQVKNETLIEASSLGKLDLVKLLLFKGADPSYMEDEALFVGLANPKIVEELLKDPRTNPDSFHFSYDQNDTVEEPITSASPLESASSQNYTDTVRVLLNYSEKYPERKFSYRKVVYEHSLNEAITNNNLKMVKLLLEHAPKSKLYHWALSLAIAYKNYDILDTLLKSDKVILDKESIDGLMELVDSIDTKALKRLLLDPRISKVLAPTK